MKFTVDGLAFRPDEGTILETASLAAIGASDHANLYAALLSAGQPRHGCVLEGLRVSLEAGRLKVTEGVALLPDPAGRLVVVPAAGAQDLPRPGAPQTVVVASAVEARITHDATGLQGAGKRLSIRLEALEWGRADLEKRVPVAFVDLDAGRVENDVARLLQPDDPEVVELVRRLRTILSNRLLLEGARGQLEYQAQVQDTLEARDHLYMASLEAAILQLRARPALSIERVRIVSELALQVRTLYRNHPRLRDLIREIVAVGYVDHDHARQLRLESAAARFYNEQYAPAAQRQGEPGDSTRGR